MRLPWSRLYRLDMTSSRSLVFFTGKNLEIRIYFYKCILQINSLYLDLGTFIPEALSKHFIAAPTAVSNW